MKGRAALAVLLGGGLFTACGGGPAPAGGPPTTTAETSTTTSQTALLQDNIAAQSDLQTAFTAGKVYYTQDNQTYRGLNPKSFAAIDTGLTAVTGTTPSTNLSVISLLAGAPGTYVAFAAWVPSSRTCWAIVDSTASNTLDGQTAFVGTLYIETSATEESACKGAAYGLKALPPGSSGSTTSFAALGNNGNTGSTGSGTTGNTGSSVTTGTGNDIATQSNLQTGLTVAKTYYTEKNQSYAGLNPTSFAAFDTGLETVAGTAPSNGPHEISLLAGASGSYAILAAWAPASQTCWAIVDSTAPSSLGGQVAFTGTLYIETPVSRQSACASATYNDKQLPSGSTSSTQGFRALG